MDYALVKDGVAGWDVVHGWFFGDNLSGQGSDAKSYFCNIIMMRVCIEGLLNFFLC